MRLLELVGGDLLRRQIHLELILNSIDLPLHGTFIEKWSLEKLGKYVECIIELLVVHIEVKVGVLFASGRIRVAAILLEESLLVVLLWVLLIAQEQHVLTKVRHAIYLLLWLILAQWVLRILQAADGYEHASRTIRQRLLLCRRRPLLRAARSFRDEEHLQIILEPDVPELPTVMLALVYVDHAEKKMVKCLVFEFLKLQ